MDDSKRELFEKLIEAVKNGDYSGPEAIQQLSDEMLEIVDGDLDQLEEFLRNMLIASFIPKEFLENAYIYEPPEEERKPQKPGKVIKGPWKGSTDVGEE
jgi:hypothetical protein